MHCKRTKTIIGTQELVYGNSPVGKLEEDGLVRTVLFPLQKGFDSDSETCFSIGIDCLPAFVAFENCIVGTVPFANSTAVAAPFARVPTINNFKNNVFVEASLFQDLFELEKRNPHYFFIEPFAFRVKSLEVFNRNVSIKTQSHFSYLLDNFTDPVLYKVELFMFSSFKAFPCSMAPFAGKGLEFFFSFKNLFSFNPNVFSKISLLQNFSFWRKNGNGKTLAVNVDSENIFSLWQFGFWFGQISDNLPIRNQSESLALPVAGNERGIFLEVPVLFDWNSDSFSGIHPEFDKETGFCAEGFAVSGNIKLDSNSFDDCSFAFGNIAFNIADNLGIERGVFFAG